MFSIMTKNSTLNEMKTDYITLHFVNILCTQQWVAKIRNACSAITDVRTFGVFQTMDTLSSHVFKITNGVGFEMKHFSMEMLNEWLITCMLSGLVSSFLFEYIILD